MRLLESPKRRDRPAERPSATLGIDRAPEPVGKVPNECLPLHRYLKDRYADMVVLSFGQIEDLLGSALPEAARTLQWWTMPDPHGKPPPFSAAWRLAGRTATPNLLARTVAFERAASK